MTRSPRLTLVGLLSLVALTAGCSSSKAVNSGDASTSSSVSGGTTTTTVAASTTSVAASTTTSATTTTTTEPAPVELVLRGDGIGAHNLGDEGQPVIDGLIAQLGAPATDESMEYPVADGLGQYTSTDGEMGFVAPAGRTVCWSIGFCAELGGAAGASMSFTGWSYREDTTGALHSTSGVTVGTRGDEAPITIFEGGCYSSGSGEVDGIRLTLQSDGVPFSSFDDSGNYISNMPPPADVTVVWMEAGENPVFLYGDC